MDRRAQDSRILEGAVRSGLVAYSAVHLLIALGRGTPVGGRAPGRPRARGRWLSCRVPRGAGPSPRWVAPSLRWSPGRRSWRRSTSGIVEAGAGVSLWTGASLRVFVDAYLVVASARFVLSGPSSSGASTDTMTARLMSLPAGAVVLVGLTVVAIGIGLAVFGLRRLFVGQLDERARTQQRRVPIVPWGRRGKSRRAVPSRSSVGSSAGPASYTTPEIGSARPSFPGAVGHGSSRSGDRRRRRRHRLRRAASPRLATSTRARSPLDRWTHVYVEPAAPVRSALRHGWCPAGYGPPVREQEGRQRNPPPETTDDGEFAKYGDTGLQTLFHRMTVDVQRVVPQCIGLSLALLSDDRPSRRWQATRRSRGSTRCSTRGRAMRPARVGRTLPFQGRDVLDGARGDCSAPRPRQQRWPRPVAAHPRRTGSGGWRQPLRFDGGRLRRSPRRARGHL